MTPRWFSSLVLLFFFTFSGHASDAALAQSSSSPTPTPTPTLGLKQSYMEFDTPSFKLSLVKASQTVAALQPSGADGFDFTPADRLERRAANNYHHLGDIILRLREQNSGAWRDYSTASERRSVIPLPNTDKILAAADLTPTFPSDIPLRITRSWLIEEGQLTLRFRLTNKGSVPIEIGALGIPVVFNNMITGRNLEQAHEICSFADPYIGLDAGYLQVTRLNGQGPALVVVPDKQTQFEAYQILNEPTRPSQTFEGAFAWMVHTKAFAENEWKGAQQWNTPTATVLQPGASKSYGLRFLLSDQIRNIEFTLAKNNRPVTVGIPGYVLPVDVDSVVFEIRASSDCCCS